ncbi:pectin lyase-like protein [Colletotrichum eremochloae]|nr:pectin lyase-like protein [Colletotrichum eremochloae]
MDSSQIVNRNGAHPVDSILASPLASPLGILAAATGFSSSVAAQSDIPKRRPVKPSCTEGHKDAPKILREFTECTDGGTVVLDKKYLISSPLDLTFLRHIDVVIAGEIHFNADPYYWADNGFKFAFQNQSVFWKLGGSKDVNIYGDLGTNESVIDGHGQLLRPMWFSFEGVEGATMSHLRMRNPPNWFNLIANSTGVIISDMDLRAVDTYRSDRVVIQKSYIINTDARTNVVIHNLDCTGSHGMSAGSLGQYKGETNIVENVYVYNTSMTDASDAARIKVWPGIETAFQTLLNGGGGLDRVRNVTYDIFRNINNDRAITITQCYGQKNQTLCEEFPANLTISDITLKNIYGTTSEKLDPQAGNLALVLQTNIRAENVTVTVPSGKSPVWECKNVDKSLLDINCAPGRDEKRNITSG